jgi:hypothetical protein
MMEQQSCRVFIEVFKPGLGNGKKVKLQTFASPLVCKYSRLLTMTGNAALKVANAFARIHQRVSHKGFSLLI